MALLILCQLHPGCQQLRAHARYAGVMQPLGHHLELLQLLQPLLLTLALRPCAVLTQTRHLRQPALQRLKHCPFDGRG